MHNIAVATAEIVEGELIVISALVCEPMRIKVTAMALGDATVLLKWTAINSEAVTKMFEISSFQRGERTTQMDTVCLGNATERSVEQNRESLQTSICSQSK